MSSPSSIAIKPTAGLKLPARVVWVDACKGICIVLVVFGHVSGGLGAAGAVGQDSFWLALRQWVYLFHMPAFFALSGYFALRLSRLTLLKFLGGRLRTVCYPYVIWTLIIVLAQFAMARFVNNPVDFHKAMRFLVEPYGYGLWFLYALLINSSAFYILTRWMNPGLLIVGLAILLYFLASRNLFSFWPMLNTAMEYFIFYAAAACVPEKHFTAFAAVRPVKMLACGLSLLIVMTILFFTGWCRLWFASLIAAALGIAGAACMSRGLGKTTFGLFWSFLGLYSLEIYLGHPLWGTLARVILERMRIDSATVLILGGVVIGVGGSLAVGMLCRTFHFPYLFRWPDKRSAAV